MSKLLADHAAFVDALLEDEALSGRLQVLALDLSKRMGDFAERSKLGESNSKLFTPQLQR